MTNRTGMVRGQGRWGTGLRTIGLRMVGMLPLGMLAAACAGLMGESKVGGESSFLRVCNANCGEDLECISSVCTRSCLVNKDSCTDLAKTAVCTNASIESGSVAVCDVACTSNDQCNSLGSHFSCDNGYCRGTQQTAGQGGAASTSQGGAASTSQGGAASTSQGGAASTSPNGASCRVAYRDYPSGTKDIPIADGSSCGSCSCDDGTLNCTKLDFCPLGQPIAPCPADVQSDPVFRESLAFIAGDSLSLTVQYGGGCFKHDFALCYEKDIFDTEPPALSLRLIHDAHGDSCEALPVARLLFDLSPLGRYVGGSSPDAGGVIGTGYGLYAYGAASCEQRQASAKEQLNRSTEATRKSCSTAADCVWVSTPTACGGTCGVVVSNQGTTAPEELSRGDFIDRVTALNAGQCSKMAELGCPMTLVDCAAVTVDCVAGQCVATAVSP